MKYFSILIINQYRLIRAIVSGDGRVLETNSYYPYGMKIDALSSTNYAKSDVPNRYKYNGKELFSESGLDWLNYGARLPCFEPAWKYDAAFSQLPQFSRCEAVQRLDTHSDSEQSTVVCYVTLAFWKFRKFSSRAAFRYAPVRYSKFALEIKAV